jgi:hypothetical protein
VLPRPSLWLRLQATCCRFVVVILGGGIASHRSLFAGSLWNHVSSSASLVEWEDESHLPLGASGCRHSTMAYVAPESTFRRLRLLPGVGRRRLSPCGHYLVVVVASVVMVAFAIAMVTGLLLLPFLSP